MSTTTALIAFLVAAAGTYAIRLSGIMLLGGDRRVPDRLVRSLRLVAPSALAAIIASSLLLDHGQWRGFGAWHLAALVAIAVAVWRRSMGLTLAIGALAFAVLLAVGL